jgi:hypothetical protein
MDNTDLERMAKNAVDYIAKQRARKRKGNAEQNFLREVENLE